MTLLLLVLTAAVPSHGGDRLPPCPESPNCVNSLDSDPARRVPPLAFSGSAAQARGQLVGAIESLPRALLVETRDDYVRAEFVSRLFRFVDDMEFLIDAGAGVIHLRSASRSGYYDFGVNRRRVERIREAFERSDAPG
jgi:uncharacterized protein (DUF1499 family)